MGSIPEVQCVQGPEMSSEGRASVGLESVCDPVPVCTRLCTVPPRPAPPRHARLPPAQHAPEATSLQTLGHTDALPLMCLCRSWKSWDPSPLPG